MKRPGPIPILLTLLALVVFSQGVLGNVAGGIGGNGQHARPFYNVAHNPNELSEASEAIDAGANALEPDLMRFAGNAVSEVGLNLNSHVGDSGLFMYHDDVLITTRTPETVEHYFDHVHALVKGGKNVALMVLDIKSAAAQYLGLDGAKKLRTAVATHLNYDGVNVAILYNVGTTSDSNYFMDNICLGPGEGVNIDGENDASAVLATLFAHIRQANAHATANCGGNPVPYNIAFGNGSFGESFGFAPNVMPSIMQASWIRTGKPDYINVAVPYAYPIDDVSRMSDYITAGADGLIPDKDFQPQYWPQTLAHLTTLAALVLARPDVYMATATDNPFHQPNEAYGLKVNTADVEGAGTDAHLTFKLIGSCGSSLVTIDSSYQKLFERNSENYVTIQSKNLGHLKQLELSSEGSCLAITAATWTPKSVAITSARWGILSEGIATFDKLPDVCTGYPATLTLGDWGRECDSTPPSAAPAQLPAANPAGWNNGDVTVTWNWTDNAGGSGIDPASCTTSSVSSGEGASPITLNATCKDLDGNTGTKSYTVKVDKTAPSVNCDAADGAWHAGDDSVACSSSDNGSGLAASAAFALWTSVPAGTETAAAFTESHRVFDLADNSTTAGPIGGNKIDKKPPTIVIAQPAATEYVHSATLTLNYTVVDGGSGVKTVTPTMDGNSTVAGGNLLSGRSIDLLTALPLGQHTFTVNAVDDVGNASPKAVVSFTLVVTAASVMESVNHLLASGDIGAKSAQSLLTKLTNATAKRNAGKCDVASNIYELFIQEVSAQSGKSITPVAAAILIADAQYLIAHCP